MPETFIIHRRRDAVNDCQYLSRDLETDVVIRKGHPINALRIFLITGTGIESQHFSQGSEFFIREGFTKVFRHEYFQFLPRRLVHKTTACLWMTIGIGNVRLDIIDRGSVHQIRSFHVDQRTLLLVVHNTVDTHTGESKTIRAEGRTSGEDTHPLVTA